MDKTITLIERAEDTIKVQAQLVALMGELKKGKTFDCIIQEHKEKRSKNANDYSWVLQDKIAKVLGRRVDDIHNEMVLQYGVIETYSIKKIAWESAKRLFDYYKVLGESSINDTEFIHIRVGLGTHTYNTKEMSKFLDGVVQEAKDLGIETKTPKELAELKSLWGANEKHNSK